MHVLVLYFRFAPSASDAAAQAATDALAGLSDVLEGHSYWLELRPLPAADGTDAARGDADALARLALATSDDGSVSRHVAATVLACLEGEPQPDAAAARAALGARLVLRHDPEGDRVARLLRLNAEAAAAHGVAGDAPAFVMDGRLLGEPAGGAAPLAALHAWAAAQRPGAADGR